MAQLNYNHLRYFWAVARDGNLTRAANALNVSQSALSLQIKKLEERLGQPLFERTGKRLVLNEAGQIALNYANVIFGTGEELLDTLLERSSNAETVLRVGALSTLSRNFQIEFLAPLFGRDDAGITVQSGGLAELTGLLRNQKLDVVLTNLPPPFEPEAHWLIHPIAEQKVGLVGHPDLADPADLADLASGDLSPVGLIRANRLILPARGSSIRSAFDTLLDRWGIEPNIFAEVDDMALLRVLARANVGLALVPPIVVKDELKSGALIEFAELPELIETFYAVTIPRRFPNPALGWLMPVRAISGDEALPEAGA